MFSAPVFVRRVLKGLHSRVTSLTWARLHLASLSLDCAVLIYDTMVHSMTTYGLGIALISDSDCGAIGRALTNVLRNAIAAPKSVPDLVIRGETGTLSFKAVRALAVLAFFWRLSSLQDLSPAKKVARATSQSDPRNRPGFWQLLQNALEWTGL